MYYYFKTWRDNGLLETLSQELSGDYRQTQGRARSPSVGIIDNQSVKATALSAQSNTSYDANKKVKGRKRHIKVDTFGLMITVWVSAAHWQDRTAAYWLIIKLFVKRLDYPPLFVFFADGGYIGKLVHFVKKDEKIKTFKVLPKRWIVERTFAWLDNCRHLSKDYERKTSSSETFMHLGQVRLLALRCQKT